MSGFKTVADLAKFHKSIERRNAEWDRETAALPEPDAPACSACLKAHLKQEFPCYCKCHHSNDKRTI